MANHSDPEVPVSARGHDLRHNRPVDGSAVASEAEEP